MEKEQDKIVRNFEENNEIIFFLNEKTTENVTKNTDAKFYGIANEQTKYLGNQIFWIFPVYFYCKNIVKRKKRAGDWRYW